ncbi:MAG: hypothetical protein Q8918_18225 [Bacteroidota bacterium]|nr:hypothetical protein [Bacteroidota bacterium]MDP4211864.1 hypothetical protein [Bacteroidota bacterium]MDP4252042.1 hypothetical protein [Bacteroidota bacterium]
MKIFVCLLGAMIYFISCSYGQVDSTLNSLAQLPNKLFSKLSSKASRLDDQITKQSEKYLEKLARKEKRLQQKLYKTDSNASKQLFTGSQEKYQQLEAQLRAQESGTPIPLQGEYLSNIDSTKTTLAFLQQRQNLPAFPEKSQQALVNASQKFNQLQAKFQQTDQIKEYIRQRKQQLKDQLARYPQSLGLNKYLNDYNQQVYYYSEQVREYKEMFNDPDRLMKEALVILNKIPAFQTFMKNNSQLAGLFGISTDYASAAGTAGLQTRDQVQSLLEGQIGSGGSGGMAALQSNLSEAHQGLDQFKDKLSNLGNGSGDMDMPSFKPNPGKTHSFLKRIEVGTNLQTTRANYFFPSTTDLGLSLGYRLSGRSTIGIGGSYKLGWGSNISHIKLSGQGASIRSFIDFQLKKSYYLSGGYELNYQQSFTSFSQISSVNDWTRSGLIGISKIVSLGGKIVKKTKVQLLFDFLSYSQIPRTQPLKFRVGYNF